MASEQGEFVANYPYLLSRYILEINQSSPFLSRFFEFVGPRDHNHTITPCAREVGLYVTICIILKYLASPLRDIDSLEGKLFLE